MFETRKRNENFDRKKITEFGEGYKSETTRLIQD